MRVLGGAIAGSLWILCASAPRAAAAASPAVIAATHGRLAHMSTYAGPWRGAGARHHRGKHCGGPLRCRGGIRSTGAAPGAFG